MAGGQGPDVDLQAYLHNVMAGSVSLSVGGRAQVGVANNLPGSDDGEYIQFPGHGPQG